MKTQLTLSVDSPVVIYNGSYNGDIITGTGKVLSISATGRYTIRFKSVTWICDATGRNYSRDARGYIRALKEGETVEGIQATMDATAKAVCDAKNAAASAKEEIRIADLARIDQWIQGEGRYYARLLQNPIAPMWMVTVALPGQPLVLILRYDAFETRWGGQEVANVAIMVNHQRGTHVEGGATSGTTTSTDPRSLVVEYLNSWIHADVFAERVAA